MQMKIAGWLGEYWSPVYVKINNGRMVAFNFKDGRRDNAPIASVYLIECNIAVSKNDLTIQVCKVTLYLTLFMI